MSSLRIEVVNYFWSSLNISFSITTFLILAFKHELFLVLMKIFIQTLIGKLKSPDLLMYKKNVKTDHKSSDSFKFSILKVKLISS